MPGVTFTPKHPGVLALLMVLVGHPAIAVSQGDTTARLSGTASSAFNGMPLAGVLVALPDARRFTVTDSTGTFTLAGVPAGRQRVRIAYQGRETEEYTFDLKRGRTLRLALVLDAGAVDLAPVVVTARFPAGWDDLAGFYARKRAYAGLGHFYTREDLERIRPLTLGALLHREAIVTHCGSRGCAPVGPLHGGVCAIPVSVNGLPFWEDGYDLIPVDEVAGVEIYRGDVTTPAALIHVPEPSLEFGRSGVFTTLRACGSIQIWTRR